jgi:hypothetical protein
MTIRWGDMDFSDPVRLKDWEPPAKPAFYAIMKGSTKNGRYSLIYVSESGNLSERASYKSHPKYNCWIDEAGSDNNLFVGISLIPNITHDQRKRLKKHIVYRANPPCNI